MRNWSSIPASKRTLPADRSACIIQPVNRHQSDPKGVSTVELFVIAGLVVAALGILANTFGADSRDSIDQDPTRATSLRYV